MKFRKRYKNNSKVNILLPLIFLFVVFLSVGYSSLNQELNITSEASFRVEESIRITDIKLVGSTFNGLENYNSSYSKDRIKTGIILNDTNSSITYQVTITNTGNVPMNLSFLDNINYSNDGITYELNEKLPYMINKGEEKKIEITYKWSSYNEESKNLDSVIRFNFIKAESVLAKGTDNATFINNSSFDRSKIESIKFMPTINVPSSAIEVWDASLNKDGSVMAYTLDNDSNDLYELYIAGYGEIKLSEASGLFYNFTNTVTLDFDNLVTTENVTSMASMFQDCSNLVNIDLSNFNTTNVTSMASMFQGCSSLEGILDLSNFNMQNVTTIQSMFFNVSKLNTLKINNWNALKLTNIKELFRYSNIVNLYMDNFNAPELTDMEIIFGNISWQNSPKFTSVKEISINNWNIPKVTNLLRMFYSLTTLETLNMENFNAPSATNVNSMFYNCKLLTNIDVSKFDTSNVTNMGSMFQGCSNLVNIGLSNFNTSKVKNMASMFQDCSNLVNIDLSNFNTTNVTSMASMFQGCSSLEGILDLSNFNMQNVTTIQSMFFNVSKLNTLKINNWNALKLTNIKELFRYSNIVNLYMDNFNAPELTDMEIIFGNISWQNSPKFTSVKEISINNWNIPKVTNLLRMFYSLTTLETLNMENFNAPSATNVNSMFYNCKLLTNIDVSKFDTSNVTNMGSMFQGCSNLVNIDLTNFDTSKVTDMSYMFNNCETLTNLNLSSFNMDNVTNMGYMLGNMSLKKLDISGINSETYEKDIFKSMLGQIGDITFYVKDSECKTLLEAIKPNATVIIKV